MDYDFWEYICLDGIEKQRLSGAGLENLLAVKLETETE